jgi:hypothetical protein
MWLRRTRPSDVSGAGELPTVPMRSAMSAMPRVLENCPRSGTIRIDLCRPHCLDLTWIVTGERQGRFR